MKIPGADVHVTKNGGHRVGADEVVDLGRTFHLELFKSPMSRLLLRSPRYPGGYVDRVDLMFLNAEFVAIRDLLPAMIVSRVEQGSPEDVEVLHTAQARRVPFDCVPRGLFFGG